MNVTDILYICTLTQRERVNGYEFEGDWWAKNFRKTRERERERENQTLYLRDKNLVTDIS